MELYQNLCENCGGDQFAVTEKVEQSATPTPAPTPKPAPTPTYASSPSASVGLEFKLNDDQKSYSVSMGNLHQPKNSYSFNI